LLYNNDMKSFVKGNIYKGWIFSYKELNAYSFCDMCGRRNLKVMYRFDKPGGDFLQLGTTCVKKYFEHV